jgi:hypothetical protein
LKPPRISNSATGGKVYMYPNLLSLFSLAVLAFSSDGISQIWGLSLSEPSPQYFCLHSPTVIPHLQQICELTLNVVKSSDLSISQGISSLKFIKSPSGVEHTLDQGQWAHLPSA